MRKNSLQIAFKNAFQGLKYALTNERNMIVHCCAAVISILFALWFGLEKLEIAVLVIIIALVIIAEMFNTAIEKIVDVIHPDYHPIAKVIKDLAAGAVLVAAIAALILGYVLFCQRIL
ncbi:diacylglycerol kinase family protein [Dendrosporobacter sp. 1207_IL3150]|uniref:diacylglycerol kinase family protein n=1 Tax=Dendrosporobacter sp. 1207_IL3150 TaxID=3084054 RepID=UPI002FDA946C